MLENLFRPMHLLVILFIALMVFGPKKLPEFGKGLGDGNQKLQRVHERQGRRDPGRRREKPLTRSRSDTVEAVHLFLCVSCLCRTLSLS